MVEENIGLAHLCARRFLGRGMEYDDLFQAGCVGLLKAVENFDTSRGVKFSTYAVPVILGEIRRLFRDGGALRVSRGLRDLSRKALEEADKLRQETGESPGVAQIAQRLGVPVEKAALALGVGQAPMSLTDGEEGGDLDIPVEAPEERMTERMTLYQILHTLEERDQKLIRCRYFQGKTQSQTAAELGMTMDQALTLASMIEKEAKKADFAKVSAVFHNRLNSGMKLQSDPTIHYVTGQRRMALRSSDLQVDSPYNTYKVSGLPVGPICNPSPEAINAALYPDESYVAEKYLYFCSKDPNTGELYFSKTLEEHNQAVSIYSPLWQAYDQERGI